MRDLQRDCVDLLRRLCLEQVPEDWVTQVWDDQFTQEHDLPTDYEEILEGIDQTSIIRELREKVSKWITSAGSDNPPPDDSNSTTQSVDLYGWGDFSSVLALDNFNVDRKNFWTILTEKKIQYKTLLALLYQFQARGLARLRQEQERELCLQSAGLYLVMYTCTAAAS